MTSPHPSTWCEIDLKALAYNFQQLQKLAEKNMSHSVGIMPVIKADAYGHGMVEIAQRLNECGCKYWAVSNVSEGVSLRQAGFKQKILLFESTLVSEAGDIFEYKLSGNTKFIQALELLQFGSWLTFYLAMLNNVNPSLIPFVDWFKKKLE